MKSTRAHGILRMTFMQSPWLMRSAIAALCVDRDVPYEFKCLVVFAQLRNFGFEVVEATVNGG